MVAMVRKNLDPLSVEGSPVHFKPLIMWVSYGFYQLEAHASFLLLIEPSCEGKWNVLFEKFLEAELLSLNAKTSVLRN